MKIRMNYTIQNEVTQKEDALSDVLNWPDLATLQEAEAHIKAYLDSKWGAGNYELTGAEEVV